MSDRAVKLSRQLSDLAGERDEICAELGKLDRQRQEIEGQIGLALWALEGITDDLIALSGAAAADPGQAMVPYRAQGRHPGRWRVFLAKISAGLCKARQAA